MRSAKLAALALLTGASGLRAELQPEELTQVELKDAMQPHWLWVNDIAFQHMTDGRAYLLDADTGTFLGMVSGGYGHGSLQLSPDGRSFALPATFYSRGTRGVRSDVVTFYDTKTLTPRDEVTIPPKRFQGIAFLSAMPLTDDGRFSLIYNFTPEQSVTVVDTASRKLVGEFPTAGCGLLYPTGPRGFFMQCGDGSLRSGTLDEAGRVSLDSPSKPLFEQKDPANEKAVRISAKEWLFFTFDSEAVAIDASGPTPKVSGRWALVDQSDTGWRIGGIQPAAIHRASGRLYVLMHKGGVETHKDPGTEIWVFDVTRHLRVARLPLDVPATSIAISSDADPLLYTTLFGAGDLEVRDPKTGRAVRKITGLGAAMTTIQPGPASVAH